MADRTKAREAEQRYRAKNLDKIRAAQAASKRRSRAANIEEHRAYQRAHYAKNRVRIRAQAKLRYRDNAEKERAYSASYRARNRDRAVSVVKAWRKANPQKTKASSRAWAKAHPTAVHAMRKRRKALERGATILDFTAQQWIALQIAYGHRCAYCDKPRKGRLTQDHILPLSKGGAHTASNIVPACKSCNSIKHTGPPLRPVQPMLLS